MQRLGLMIAALLAVQSRAPCSVEPAPGAGTQPPARDEALRKELIRMAEEDQASGSCVRSSPSDLLLCRDTREVRRDNQLALDRIIAEHGWPGVTLVGVDGQRAAWIKDRDLDWKSDARVGGAMPEPSSRAAVATARAAVRSRPSTRTPTATEPAIRACRSRRAVSLRAMPRQPGTAATRTRRHGRSRPRPAT